MKRIIQTIPAMAAAVFYAIALAGPGAKANPIPTITGSIGFGASGVTINSPTLATATSFAVSAPFVTTRDGTYSAVPMFYSDVTFNGFTFHPPVGSITPLWTFQIGSTVYSFDATTDSSFWNPGLDSWEIGGDGIAMITGYAPSLGTWNVNLSETDASFVFDSSAGASGVAVPDGGSTMALLGGGLLGLGLFSRKFSY
ncbi:MAG: VPDSG-CTERM sorting domain-containing protein [Verrucomicrobiota bacterium]|jgi:hypothetical protein